jgi:hypothetical protein
MSLLCLYRDGDTPKTLAEKKAVSDEEKCPSVWMTVLSANGLKMKICRQPVPIKHRSKGRKKLDIRARCLKKFPNLKKYSCCIY